MVDVDRLNNLIAEKGVSKKFLSEKAGKARTYISCAMCGKGTISAEALQIFADELGTTVEYLRGETDNPAKEKEPVLSDELSNTGYELLSAENKQFVDSLIEKLLRSQFDA